MGNFYSAVMDDPIYGGSDSQIIEEARNEYIQGPDGQNRPRTLIGHFARCDTCKSASGVLAAPGSPHHNRMVDLTASQAREALGGDLMTCECEPPPRIIPIYGCKSTVSSESNPTAEAATQVEPTAVTPGASSGPGDYDTHFVLTDMHTGQPLAGYAWGMETPDGEREGCTGADGKTDIISGHEGQSVKLNWILQTEMGIRP